MDEKPAAQPSFRSALVNLRRHWRAYQSQPRARIGFWFGLLLLFAPVFYVLLWWKRYSVTARVGWGMWVGLIVFVKCSGQAEPLIDVKNTMPAEELEAIRRGGSAEQRAAIAPRPISLEGYLAKLEGGGLGALLAGYHVEGKQIRLEFKPSDGYFGTREEIARISVGAAYSLFYGRDFEQAALHYTFQEQPLRLAISRPAFGAFFRLEEAALRALGESHAAFRASPLGSMSAQASRAFLARFASEQP